MDKRIILSVVEKEQLRLFPLEQVEDWTLRSVSVAKMKDWRSELAVLIHGLFEKCACDAKGITVEEVDAWDRCHGDLDEPGDHPKAPYHIEHKKGMRLEKFVVKLLDLDWDEHQDNIDNVFK